MSNKKAVNLIDFEKPTTMKTHKIRYLIILLLQFFAFNVYSQAPSLHLSDSVINESREDGEDVILILENPDTITFKDTIDHTLCTFYNLPAGVNVDTIIVNDTTRATILFTGNRSIDYDNDIIDFYIEMPNSEFNNYDGPNFESDSALFRADPGDESLIISVIGTIDENAEDGGKIAVKLNEGTFITTIVPGQFSLTGLPADVSWSVSKEGIDSVVFTLSGNSSYDFDDDIIVTIGINTNQADDTTSTGDITETATVITAIKDNENITISNPETINEGAEDGGRIRAGLTGGQFVSSPAKAKWNFDTLPAGVEIDYLNRINSQTVDIYLKGYRKQDFDSHWVLLLNVEEDQVVDHSGEGDFTNISGARITRVNDNPETITASISGSITEGSEDGGIIEVELDKGTFIETPDTSEIDLNNLPNGVKKGQITRIDSTNLTIEVYGNSTEDYDGNRTITVQIQGSQYNDGTVPLSDNVTFTGLTESFSISGSLPDGPRNHEHDIFAGKGATIVITLTNATWATDISSNPTKRNALLGAFSGADFSTIESEITASDVSRDNATQLTITIPKITDYYLSGNQTMSFNNIPVSCLQNGTADVPGNDSWTVYNDDTQVSLSGSALNGTDIQEETIFTGGDTITMTVRNDTWWSNFGNDNNQTNNNFFDVGNFTTHNHSGEFDEVVNLADYTNIIRENDTVAHFVMPFCRTFYVPPGTNNAYIQYNIDATVLTNTSSNIGTNGVGNHDLDIVNDAQRAEFSGTIFNSTNETDIRTGGKTIVITLYNQHWHGDVGENQNESTDLINSFSGEGPWGKVKTELNNNRAAYINQLADTNLVIITLPPVPGYFLTEDETVNININDNCFVNRDGNLNTPTTLTISNEADYPSVTLAGTDSICNDGSKGSFYVILEGKAPWSFSFYVNDSVFVDSITNVTEEIYLYQTSDTGKYTVKTLTDADYTLTAPDPFIKGTASINAYPTTEVRIQKPQGNQSYNVSVDSVSLIGSPSGGVFSGPGVTAYNNTFHPSFLPAGQSDTIIYTYTDINGCVNRDTSIYTILSGDAAILPLTTLFCNDADSLEIRGVISDDTVGTFYIREGTDTLDQTKLINNPDSTAILIPSGFNPGNYTIVYKWTKGGTPDEVFTNIRIVKVPENVYVEGITDKCYQNAPFSVTGKNLESLGGDNSWTFSGPSKGFSSSIDNNQATIYPDSIEPGAYRILYQYTTQDGCLSNIDTSYFNIDSLPVVDFTVEEFYNNEGEIDTLYGFPAGSTSNFQPEALLDTIGSGIVSFNPQIPLTTYDITYSFTDQNGCTNDTTKTIRILQPEGEISGVDPSYCYFGDAPDTITGRIDEFFGTPTPDKFMINRKSTGFTVISDTSIIIYPDSLLSGNQNEVVFVYKIGTIPFEIKSDVFIDSIGNFSFGNDMNALYCNNAQVFDLDPLLPADGVGTDQFTFSSSAGGTVNQEFDPSLANVGIDTIYCTFIRGNTGCTKEIYKTVKILPVPQLNFDVPDPCVNENIPTDSVVFVNTTSQPDSIVEWLWGFDDIASGAANASTLENPVHRYEFGGQYTIELFAKHVNNCESSIQKDFLLEEKPTTNFTWQNDCYTGEPITFQNTSLLSGQDDVFYWKFFDNSGGYDSIYHSEKQEVIYDFKEVDEYEIELIQITSRGCSDTIRKMIYLSPSVVIADEGSYFEDFEDGRAGWISDAVNNTYINSWQYGNDEAFFGAYSGSNAYYISQVVDTSEQSYVISPCFSLEGLKRPMIKLQVKKSFERNRNAAFLQYTEDGGSTWNNAGSFNDGINWYNSFQINRGVAGVTEGWTGEIPFNEDSSWVEARQSLDQIKNNPGVRFRIAYSSDGNIIENRSKGFAFDNVWIGERTKRVLLEHMTNSSSMPAKQANDKINAVVSSNEISQNDFIDIHYHLGYPGEDPMNNDNPVDPSTRSFYYGISSIPYSLMDGGLDGLKYDYSKDENSWNITDIKQKSLEDPKFRIKLETETSGNTLNIRSKVISLDWFNDTEMTVHVVVLEDSLTGFTGVGGQAMYRNVVKKMLPDAAGTSFIRSWSWRDEEDVSLSWEMENIYDPSKLKVAAFVQNEYTSEVMQAVINNFEASFAYGVRDYNKDDNNNLLVFPNPASDFVNVIPQTPLEKDADIILINSLGAVVKSERLFAGENLHSMDVSLIEDGIYFIKISDNKQLLGLEKLIITR